MHADQSTSNNQHQKFLVIIAGPTAVGKTKVAIEVAKHFKTEIISADSRQVFQELKIGVARPSDAELKEVRHHFISNKSIHEYLSAGEYEREVIALLNDLFDDNNVVILCGGTGFYIDAICNGFDEIPAVDPGIREQLNSRLKDTGLGPLQQHLKELDPKAYASMDIQNPQRVVRALEVSIGTGIPFSSFRQRKRVARSFTPVKICLDTDRQKLYRNIDQRINEMMAAGLIEEARSVFAYKDINALQTVGYRELFDYFEGKITLEESVSAIKQDTRNYAKRQLTWFRKDKEYKWFDPEQLPSIIAYLDDLVK